MSDTLTSKYPLVSVIIPVLNEEKYLSQLLESLKQQTYPQAQLEIMFIDGQSTDRSLEILRQAQMEFSAMQILSNPQRITPVALNIGIKQAKGDIIVRWDAHAIYAQDYIEQCVEFLAKTGADNVGGPVQMIGDTPVREAIRLATTCAFGIGNSHYHYLDREGDVDTVTFGAFRREVFAKIGLFDEELIRNQDDEFNFRITLNGGRCYLTPAIQSWYYPRDSLKALWKQYFQYGFWKVRVIQKHGRPASLRHLVPGAFAFYVYLACATLFFPPWSYWVWLPCLLSYFPLWLYFSLSISRREKFKTPWLLGAVFLILHLSYGTGFLKGLIIFTIKPLKTK